MKNLKLIVVTAAQRVISQCLEFLICHGSVATRETALEMRIHPPPTSQIHLRKTLKATVVSMA
jgi:hypothetical protein